MRTSCSVAASVRLRSPPPSCSRITAPLSPTGAAPATICCASTPLRQSWASRSEKATVYPSCSSRFASASVDAETDLVTDVYGMRTSVERRPSADSMAIWLSDSSIRWRQPGTDSRFTWVNVWIPMSFPLRHSSRRMPGCASARVPTTKNVACTCMRCNNRRRSGVHFGSGPSSNVNAMRRAGVRTSRPALACSKSSGPRGAWVPRSAPVGGSVLALPMAPCE